MIQEFAEDPRPDPWGDTFLGCVSQYGVWKLLNTGEWDEEEEPTIPRRFRQAGYVYALRNRKTGKVRRCAPPGTVVGYVSPEEARTLAERGTFLPARLREASVTAIEHAVLGTLRRVKDGAGRSGNPGQGALGGLLSTSGVEAAFLVRQ